MRTNLSQKDLKQMISDIYDQTIKDISFNLKTKVTEQPSEGSEKVPVFDNCTVTVINEENVSKDLIIHEDELKAMIAGEFDSKGYKVNSETGIEFNMNMRYPGSLLTSRARHTGSMITSRTEIPVFRGCSVEYQEKNLDKPDEPDEAEQNDIDFTHAIEQISVNEGQSL